MIMPAATITMEDGFGIDYMFENASQFWSELEDVLHIPNDTTLSLLDSALKRYLQLCAAYHEQYLQSPLQLAHACHLLLDSELFVFHSERMCEILIDDVRMNTNPHSQLILYNALLCYGGRDSHFFRVQKRWQPLIPLLMDHVLVEIDPDIEDTYFGLGSSIGGSVPVPIEAKLRSLGVRLLYEVCRVQKLSVQGLRIFDDSFLDYLFDLVEQTRSMQDETFNYSVIKLIVALNEQCMVAALCAPSANASTSDQQKGTATVESKNRVLHVLMRRLGTTKAFGENMIFMLNRANHTAEDLCMQLLVLKILYLLFTTKGTSEYFYTNDLCVLVDVFLRELVDLDEDSNSLRHAYLRVLHPLLTKTQLRSVPYKRPQIVVALESLIQNARIRDINPTTKRLVERCLGGEWCVQFKTSKHEKKDDSRVGSPSCESATSSTYAPENLFVSAEPSMTTAIHLERSSSIGKSKTLKTSKSVEFKKSKLSNRERLRYPNNGSSFNLNDVPLAASSSSSSSTVIVPAAQVKRKTTSAHCGEGFNVPADRHLHVQTQTNYHPNRPPLSSNSLPPSPNPNQNQVEAHSLHRVPPAPPKRRKPPAIPVGRTNGGATITAIRSSATSPLKMG